MAHVQVCDPCFHQDGKLEPGEELEWRIGNINGTVTLCAAHNANYAAGFIFVEDTEPEPEQPEVFVCDECERTFGSGQGLKVHKRRSH